MGLVALAAAALSFQSLWHLGVLAEYGDLAWAYPIVLDLGAAASCAAWLHTRGRQALGMTWALLTVSVLLNGTVHYLESTHQRPGWVLIVAVAAVPPAVLGLCVHLAVGLGEGTQDPRTPEGVADLDTPDLHWAETNAGDDRHPAPVVPAGWGRRRVAKELGVSDWTARRMLAERDGANR
jgi:hypothetical protein